MSALPEQVVNWGLYLRESDESQLAGVEFNSMHSQESYLRKWVASQSPNARVYDVSGDVESCTSLHGRDALMRLVHDAEHGKIEAVVAYEIDRWARNVADYTARSKGGSPPRGKARMRQLPFGDSPRRRADGGVWQMAGFAQYFSRLVGRKVKTKRAEMAAKGMWLGGAMPFGYKNEDGKPVVVGAEAATVRLIFDLFARERSAAIVRHQLRARGASRTAPAPTGTTPTSRTFFKIASTSASCATPASPTADRRSRSSRRSCSTPCKRCSRSSGVQCRRWIGPTPWWTSCTAGTARPA